MVSLQSIMPTLQSIAVGVSTGVFIQFCGIVLYAVIVSIQGICKQLQSGCFNRTNDQLEENCDDFNYERDHDFVEDDSKIINGEEAQLLLCVVSSVPTY